MNKHKKSNQKTTEILILVVSIFLSSYLMIWGVRFLPIENTTLGLDWRTIWNGIYRGNVVFGNSSNHIGGMYTPPWGILFLLPLGFLPFRDSWGLTIIISLVALTICVPKKNNKPDIMAILLLVLSFPSLRNLADGNLEGLIIGGIALALWSYQTRKPILLAVGILLASIKFQETWLLSLVLMYLIIKKWTSSDTLKTVIFGGMVVGISMIFWGRDWVASLVSNSAGSATLSSAMGMGSLIDISLSGALERISVSLSSINIIVGLLLLATFFLLYIFDRRDNLFHANSVSLLLTASMLIAPYVSGNSFLTVIAIGIVPLFQGNRILGMVLFFLVNVPYFFSQDMLYYYQSYYWTVLLVGLWLISAWKSIVLNKKQLTPHQP